MNNDVQEIKDKVDVVDLINEYVQLKPAGVNHKGLCPFHHEKSPSFMANRERHSWHCFGCSKGGDIFTFIEEIEGMEFKEALKYLADKAGVVLTKNFSGDNGGSQKNKIKEINHEATRFFHNFLLKMAISKPAIEYLSNRGLTLDTIETWQIGFVADQWDLLTQYLLKKGYSIDDLVASGLTIKRDVASAQSGKGFYDRFRGRIMFPIWDVHDSVVGFTGRVLVETERSGGKYVNTPQTVVYDKSRVIFGLNKAKKTIRSQDLIVMTEGQMDVIACHHAGMANVVASSGTALTEHQIKLLKRYSNNINMAFDADEAGVKAAKRGIDLALQAGMNVRVIQIPDGAGKDPDEVLKKNKQVWFTAVENAEAVMDWYFNRAFNQKNLSDPKQKQEVAAVLLREIKNIPFAVERDHWLQILSQRLGVDVPVLREDLVYIKNEQKEAHSTQSTILEKQNNILEKKTKFELLFERFLILFLRYPKIKIPNSKFQIPNLSTPCLQTLYESIQKSYTEGNIDINLLRQECHVDNKENIVDILLMQGELDFSDVTEQEGQKEIEKIFFMVQNEANKTNRKNLEYQIKQAESVGDQENLKKLLQEFQALS
ncbi:MAG: DNA primase [Candidatus Magasanikbacteria bacterium CG_4_10_14_0_2_um_filter_37_12]|uniref:DNA primase n=1 Tax=Candidatus Magasanikbacteria bacterium CG_4_10_14_0_2_um_filter_37_12 TaxID=1974637 RepID=A0A2M7V7D3_9BACT|nr:MAG: DNA primase [Candidatus Magasanikbacteria bacterium CG_4_10_14_0_2_um_filter_37_12]